MTVLAAFFGVAVWFVVGWTVRGVRDQRRADKLMRKLRADAMAQLELLFGAKFSADGMRCDCPLCTRQRAEKAAGAN